MTTPIRTDDATIQSGSSAASSSLDTAMAASGRRGPTAGVDPRLTAAVDDAGAQNRHAADRTDDGIKRTKKDSAGKTDIDKDGAGRMDGLNSAALGALGAAGAALMGGGSQGGGAGAGAPQMPPMPQLAAPTTGQAIPGSLSSPAAAQLIARLLSGNSGVVGSGGLLTAAGIGGGGSGTVGPGGAGRNQYEQKLLGLAGQVVAARLPYAWGGGTVNGPSQGTRDGGAADAAGDYAKSGFDCSSLARYLVYQSSGIEIPRTSQAQYAAGVTISASEARPGDLLFPSYAGVPPHHVQVYVGEGKVVEAQQSGTNIMFSNAPAGTFKRFVISS